jgi:hypothetical protein
VGKGFCIHHKKPRPRFTPDLLDLRHPVTALETPAQPRCDQEIPCPDIRGQGQVLDVEPSHVSGTLGEGMGAIAQYFHRQGVIGIADQQGPRGARGDGDDLPHDTILIQHHGTLLDTVVLAHIEQHLMAKGVEAHHEDRGQHGLVIHELDLPIETAQASVFRLKGSQALQLRPEDQVFPTQCLIFLQQGMLAARVEPEMPHRPERRVDHAIQRLDELIERMAHIAQHAA